MKVSVFFDVISMCYDALNTPMTIYGFTFSFWDVLMFMLIVGVIFGFVRRVFYEE